MRGWSVLIVRFLVGSGVAMWAGCGSNGPIRADSSQSGIGGSESSDSGGGTGGTTGAGGTTGGQPTCVPGTARGTRVGLQNATATYSQTASGPFGVARIIDGVLDDDRGWAVDGPEGTARAATAALQTGQNTASYPGGTRLTFVLRHYSAAFGPHALGRFRLSVTTSDRTQFANGIDGTVTPGNVGADGIWTVLTPTAACALDGIATTVLGDGSVRIAQNTLIPMVYSVVAETPLTAITGVRLETLKDPLLPFNGPGLQVANGNFVLTELEVSVEAR